jgi:AcrR family transcriptional regulator
MAKKEDRRIQKSRKAINKAFIDLLVEKGFSAISVHDIAKKADINRGTFYLHYQDKYDLFKQYVDELLRELSENVGKIGLETGGMKTGLNESNPYVQLFYHFQKYSIFYKVMFSYKGDIYFYNQVTEVFKKYLYQEFSNLGLDGDGGVDKEFLMYFIVHAHFGVISYWFQNDMSDSPEVMGEKLKRLLYTLSKSYLRDNETT